MDKSRGADEGGLTTKDGRGDETAGPLEKGKTATEMRGLLQEGC